MDGSMRCSRTVLNNNSTFFYDQLNGRDGLKNQAVFNYNFPLETVKCFLDAMHGLQTDSVDIVALMKLLQFLSFEGKKGTKLLK